MRLNGDNALAIEEWKLRSCCMMMVNELRSCVKDEYRARESAGQRITKRLSWLLSSPSDGKLEILFLSIQTTEHLEAMNTLNQDDEDELINQTEELRRLGIRISIDIIDAEEQNSPGNGSASSASSTQASSQSLSQNSAPTEEEPTQPLYVRLSVQHSIPASSPDFVQPWRQTPVHIYLHVSGPFQTEHSIHIYTRPCTGIAVRLSTQPFTQNTIRINARHAHTTRRRSAE
ncbi:MAG: hypothetical protein LQ346_006662 [Caloplaca aetnensis]|nr:MAG: hypothetical protein LQ346_006662 [Caloplaca aetnensis]